MMICCSRRFLPQKLNFFFQKMIWQIKKNHWKKRMNSISLPSTGPHSIRAWLVLRFVCFCSHWSTVSCSWEKFKRYSFNPIILLIIDKCTHSFPSQHLLCNLLQLLGCYGLYFVSHLLKIAYLSIYYKRFSHRKTLCLRIVLCY